MSTNIPYKVGEPLMKATGVNLNLGGRPILRDVNLQINDLVRPGLTQGQVVGLLGPSGMGKTQLFRILAGLNKPDSGTVEIGSPLKPVEVGRVGVVAQDYPLFRNRSVMGNLILAGRQAGMDPGQAQTKANEMLSRFDLSDQGDKYPALLSGGQRQRVAISQQLMCSDGFLLMDEPFSGLDPLAVDAMCKLLNEVSSSDELKTIIIVTHDISAALRVCDHLMLLGRDRDADGKVIPGARIQEDIDLIEAGLAWVPDLHMTQSFFTVESGVHARFAAL